MVKNQWKYLSRVPQLGEPAPPGFFLQLLNEPRNRGQRPRAAGLFEVGGVAFVGEHFFSGAPAPAAFLAAEAFDGLTFCAGDAEDFFFQPFGQPLAGPVAVHRLGPLFLAPNRDARGDMDQNNATGHLVYILSSGAAGSDKPLFQIGFLNTHGAQPIF